MQKRVLYWMAFQNVEQARELDILMNELGYGSAKVINIALDDTELMRRMLGRGRKDDTEETIKNRLNVYKAQTMPVREYYSKNSAVFDIYGIGSISEINQNILEVLK